MGTIIKKIATTLLALIASMVILSVVLVISIVVGVGLLMPSEEISVKRGSLLELNLSTQIVEKSELTPLNGLLTALGEMPQTTSLFSLLRAIECAAEDPNITALSLRMDGSYNLPLATASELREALLDFRRVSSKPIYSYSEGYSQSGYYLASIADSVFINPLGSITWQGVSVDGIFYGDLLKNVGVKAEVFRPEGCDYKSAIEPYTSSKMSSESREQNGRIVDDIWGNIVGEVSRARGINIGTLYRMASDRIIIEPEEALREGMVSAIAYRDQYDRAIERLGVVRDRERDGEPLRTISSARYANRIDLLIEEDDSTRGENSEKIAIIYADGVIVDGDIPSSRGDEVVSGVISKQLRKARSDESVKAVILRVNSPGGSALAAEVIWREVELLRGEKPVIVSIGSYGASGGYYISAPADMIFV
ncbi:MAG: S49 family peptidase, partial [Rikenellaceae bacterium]